MRKRVFLVVVGLFGLLGGLAEGQEAAAVGQAPWMEEMMAAQAAQSESPSDTKEASEKKPEKGTVKKRTLRDVMKEHNTDWFMTDTEDDDPSQIGEITEEQLDMDFDEFEKKYGTVIFYEDEDYTRLTCEDYDEKLFAKYEKLNKKWESVENSLIHSDKTYFKDKKWIKIGTQLIKILDNIIKNHENEEGNFAHALEEKLECLNRMEFKAEPCDFSKSRAFAFGIDEKKHPRFARILRAQCLSNWFNALKNEHVDEKNEKLCIQIMEEELTRYGKDELLPATAELAAIILWEFSEDEPIYKIRLEKYKKIILNASNPKTRAVFQKYEESREE